MFSNKIVLKPKVSDLAQADPHLADLHRYVLRLVRDADNEIAGKNAGLLYLTLINGFKEAGITEFSWTSTLCLEINGRDFEVRCAPAREPQSDTNKFIVLDQ